MHTLLCVPLSWSVHLSMTEARYLTPHLVEGVPWDDVCVTMQQLAQPPSEGFVAKTGDDTELYSLLPVSGAVATPVPLPTG